MDNFEFLRSVNLGQYLPLDSPIHRLDARARLLAGAVLLLAVTLAHHPLGLLLGWAVFLAALRLAQVPLKFALRGLLPPLPFLLILALLQVFINPYPDAAPIFSTMGPLVLSGGDLWAGAVILLRFGALILGLSLVSFTLSTSEMLYGLQRLLRPLARLGLPAGDLVMVAQVTLRFLPSLAQSMERVAKAQASRGADWGTGRGGLFKRVGRIIPLLVPLFLISLRRAERMALAMDARGYGGPALRSSLVEMHFTRRDALVIAAAVLLSALLLWL